MVEQVKCVHCKAIKYIKWGKRKTENRGIIQKYKCLACGKYFTPDEGFYRMRNSPEKITAGIDLYFSNLSSRKVRNHFRRHWAHNASHVSILDWCRRYTLKVNKYVDTLQPKLSGEYYADETEIGRRKTTDIFWCNVDWGTRYINATLYSPNDQSVNEAVEFLKKVEAKGKPKYIQTDAAKFYPRAFRKVFYSNKANGLTVEHRINNFHKTGKHNVRIETVFSKIKDRVNDFRGLKALWSAPILMQGIILQHNFIEAHTTTGKVPSELAGVKLETGDNRWLGLIKMSVKL
ncbi:DDE-type integrase/transposase/recombinase [Candidatus Woesearchaeota archaeon]|nr:DDE-type integrase/transposase/recombinase [Candidatus Woesearchaeota archaeon]